MCLKSQYDTSKLCKLCTDLSWSVGQEVFVRWSLIDHKIMGLNSAFLLWVIYNPYLENSLDLNFTYCICIIYIQEHRISIIIIIKNFIQKIWAVNGNVFDSKVILLKQLFKTIFFPYMHMGRSVITTNLIAYWFGKNILFIRGNHLIIHTLCKFTFYHVIYNSPWVFCKCGNSTFCSNDQLIIV